MPNKSFRLILVPAALFDMCGVSFWAPYSIHVAPVEPTNQCQISTKHIVQRQFQTNHPQQRGIASHMIIAFKFYKYKLRQRISLTAMYKHVHSIH